MARKYDDQEFDRRIIEAEIDACQRKYEAAQERHGWSNSNSAERTMRKYDVLGNALAAYLRSRKEREADRQKLSDIHDVLIAELKRIDQGFRDGDLRSILLRLKAIAERVDG